MIQFEVECHTVLGQLVAVCGSADSLGNWDLAKAKLLEPKRYPIWEGVVAVDQGPVEFKYALVEAPSDTAAVQLLRWEGDFPNRQADPHKLNAARIILNDRFGDAASASVQVIMDSAESTPDLGGAAAAAEAVAGLGGEPDSRQAEQQPDEQRPPAQQPPQLPADGEQRICTDESPASPRPVGVLEGFNKKYELKPNCVLGTGMSGGVCVAVARATGAEVAVKTLPTRNLTQHQLDQTLAEVQNQLSMNHPNICRLLEVWEEPGCLRMVLERLKGPDLYEHLSRRGRYFERDAIHCVRQIAAAVAYCHRHGVCHRDLKLENFCLEDDSQDARLKMIDFGLSENFENLPMTDACGTLYYVAPEVLRSKYNEKCDMWSLGVLTYILLDGRPPFAGKDDRDTFRKIRAGVVTFPRDRWRSVSREAQDFVSSLLKVNPKERLSAEEALAHPWLSSRIADTETKESLALDSKVLEGMRAFTRSNALKRAILAAVAPAISVDKVSRWADHFQALDEHGTGMVAVKDLAEWLSKNSMNPEEAQAIAAALATTDDSEFISYSAFLAACLGAHETLKEEQLQELFKRFDTDNDGKISAEQVCEALGDVVDMEALQEELENRSLSYSDFRWLLLRPNLGPNIFGLRQLLGAFKHVGLPASWRVDTRVARKAAAAGTDEDVVVEAARRENAAWRMWHRKQQQVKDGGFQAVEEEEDVATQTTASESASATQTALSELPPSFEAELPPVSSSSSTSFPAEWSVSTVEAKLGDLEAARRENLAWRTWNKAQLGEQHS